MAKKSTSAEKEYRVNRVARMLSTGSVRSEVVQYAASEWGVSARTADAYMAEAREILKKDWDIDRRTFTAELMSQLSSLAKDCRKHDNQKHVVLGCINTMAKIAHILEK